MAGRPPTYNVGHKYTDSYGTEFEIVDYVNSKNVQVKNLTTGDLIWTKNEFIQGKRTPGAKYKPRTKRNPAPVIGQEFESENHGRCTIIDIYGYKMSVKFHNTGNVKHNVYRSVTYSGKVADPEIGPIAWRRFREQYAIGKIFSTKYYGDIEIVANDYANNITVKWLDTGTIQTNVTSNSIQTRALKDANNPDRFWNYLNVDLDRYYIYVVLNTENEVVYIGKGINKRYTHVKSGSSHNKELNRHYFCNGNDLTVKILQYFDNEKEVIKQEEWLIKFLKPIYNIAYLIDL